MRGVLAATLLVLVTACAPTPTRDGPGEDATYPTHCGVGQATFRGTLYYPTGIYKDNELIATGSDEQIGGPTPWEAIDGTMSSNETFGTFVAGGDRSAEFLVNGTDYSIRLSADRADAAWYIEGCA